MDWIDVLLGAVLGALGMYFVNKYTDKRRASEQAEQKVQELEDLFSRFPNTLHEMKKDVQRPEDHNTRYFYVSKTNRSLWAPVNLLLFTIEINSMICSLQPIVCRNLNS